MLTFFGVKTSVHFSLEDCIVATFALQMGHKISSTLGACWKLTLYHRFENYYVLIVFTHRLAGYLVLTFLLRKIFWECETLTLAVPLPGDRNAKTICKLIFT